MVPTRGGPPIDPTLQNLGGITDSNLPELAKAQVQTNRASEIQSPWVEQLSESPFNSGGQIVSESILHNRIIYPLLKTAFLTNIGLQILVHLFESLIPLRDFGETKGGITEGHSQGGGVPKARSKVLLDKLIERRHCSAAATSWGTHLAQLVIVLVADLNKVAAHVPEIDLRCGPPALAKWKKSAWRNAFWGNLRTVCICARSTASYFLGNRRSWAT